MNASSEISELDRIEKSLKYQGYDTIPAGCIGKVKWMWENFVCVTFRRFLDCLTGYYSKQLNDLRAISITPTLAPDGLTDSIRSECWNCENSQEIIIGKNNINSSLTFDKYNNEKNETQTLSSTKESKLDKEVCFHNSDTNSRRGVFNSHLGISESNKSECRNYGNSQNDVELNKSVLSNFSVISTIPTPTREEESSTVILESVNPTRANLGIMKIAIKNDDSNVTSLVEDFDKMYSGTTKIDRTKKFNHHIMTCIKEDSCVTDVDVFIMMNKLFEKLFPEITSIRCDMKKVSESNNSNPTVHFTMSFAKTCSSQPIGSTERTVQLFLNKTEVPCSLAWDASTKLWRLSIDQAAMSVTVTPSSWCSFSLPLIDILFSSKEGATFNTKKMFVPLSSRLSRDAFLDVLGSLELKWN